MVTSVEFTTCGHKEVNVQCGVCHGRAMVDVRTRRKQSVITIEDSSSCRDMTPD